MRRSSVLALALTLGLALSVVAGAVSVVGSTAAPAPEQTRDLEANAGATMSTEPWPGADAIMSEAGRGFPDDPSMVTIVLAARWGYVDDPAVAGFEGRWHLNDTGTGGAFLGQWHLLTRRMGGYLQGRFTLPDDGQGEFRGMWNVTGSHAGGFLWGDWVRVSATTGYFDGKWNVTGDRHAGALAGHWVQSARDGGGFRGEAVAASSIAPVDWDGALHTTDGTVAVLRTVRFERDDRILPRTDRQTVGWESITTVNWDGGLFVLRFPRDGSAPNVTLDTAQIGFEWSARELARLHVRERVDGAGHVIEVAAFLLERRPGPEFVKFTIGMRWGNLSSENGSDEPSRDATVWNGFAQITVGGLALDRALSFERGDVVLPRDNRVTIEWQSATTTGWDGLHIVAYVPLAHLDDTYYTLHAGSFTHVFTLRELPGDHTFDAGHGNAVQVRAVRG